MKILITGGAGFQGSHLAEYFLKKGHEITILNTYSEEAEGNIKNVSGKVRTIWGSITDKEIVDKTVRGQDLVFHLAARVNVDESIAHPLDCLEVNIKGTYNVLEAVTKGQKRLIYASTCEVYGAPQDDTLINEKSEMRPHSPYAASKAGADRLSFAYYKTYGTNVTIVRPFNIYGERQKENEGGALIAILVKKALDGEHLKIFGDGRQTRDYMNIDDLIRAYDLVFSREDLAGQAINFGTGKETSVKDIAEYIGKKLGVPVEFGAGRPGEVLHFGGDLNKAEGLGFKTKVDIWEGIDRYIGWRRANA